jgi:hypothetical protein
MYLFDVPRLRGGITKLSLAIATSTSVRFILGTIFRCQPPSFAKVLARDILDIMMCLQLRRLGENLFTVFHWALVDSASRQLNQLLVNYCATPTSCRNIALSVGSWHLLAQRTCCIYRTPTGTHYLAEPEMIILAYVVHGGDLDQVVAA